MWVYKSGPQPEANAVWGDHDMGKFGNACLTRLSIKKKKPNYNTEKCHFA